MNTEIHSDETIAPYTLPRYTRQWVYTFLALAAAVTWYFKVQHPAVTPPPASAAPPLAQDSYWFFALRLPNPAPDMAPGELYRKTSDWLNALRRSGFHPMLLSDVKTRLSKGMLLPEKTIVLSIDEALLTAYETYGPLLRDLKIPAVLMSSLKPLRRGDRGYLSFNAVQKLPANGLWDVILVDSQGPAQLLAPQQAAETLMLPPNISPWASAGDRSLANQVADLRRPRRLAIDWRWSGMDLVNRLQAETPVHPNGSRLGARRILDRSWGIVVSKTAPVERFSLNAPDHKRGAEIEWLGTRGIEDFQIDFSLTDATGQVWFMLRSTGEGGDSIRVGFHDGKVIVREHLKGRQEVRAMTDWPLVFPWRGTIELNGTELRVVQNGQTIMATRVTHRARNAVKSVLQFMVYDQLFGAAQVRDASIEMRPLVTAESIFAGDAQ